MNLPTPEDFPPGTTFLIKEFDVPLARVPAQGWFNWYDGTPRSYDPSSLTVSNNWPARDFDEWVQLICPPGQRPG